MAAQKTLILALMATVVVGDGAFPGFKTDPNTTKYCTFWFDNDGTISCQDIVDNFVSGTKADFLRWNPSVTTSCGNFLKDQSYCVEARNEPKTTITTAPSSTTTTTTFVTTTTTKPSNGVTTPLPIQPDMVSNCNKFHHIFPGNTCDQITSFEHISMEDFIKWNPKVGSQCTGLVVDANACVGVLGGGTPTNPGNGIQTPQPTQPGMVGNCNQFHHIFPGNTCDQIAAFHHISLQDFATWNPKVGPQCTGLVADANACVGVIGGGTPTNPGNGIETPQPTQPGMIGNCNLFHHIFPGNTCDQITSFRGISMQDFITWNPKVGAQCTGLVADANACVGVIGGTPTNPGNGVQTPQPTQPGMVKNCALFHHIFPGNTCDQIAAFHHISLQDFATWNPQVGPQCTGLLADANACVGLIH